MQTSADQQEHMTQARRQNWPTAARRILKYMKAGDKQQEDISNSPDKYTSSLLGIDRWSASPIQWMRLVYGLVATLLCCGGVLPESIYPKQRVKCSCTAEHGSFHDHHAVLLDGSRNVSLAEYRGTTLLVVTVATF
ncbi:hypothetical protein Bbelb_423550 [Branchiostoma belcheri]|nr:hypothetical protein Bbelb_423550 [Branchiostoma belcheri]